nr:unnamed protein product [Callosobruchus analis]
MRHPYHDKNDFFLEDNIEVKEPLDLFNKWFQVVKSDTRTVEPNAIDGYPTARYVLLKGYSKDGFIFFTHYTSRKGQQLEENPRAALTFYWEHYSRSVRIEGDVEKLSFDDAEKYFKNRPYQSQIGALCSNQSFPVASRKDMEEIALQLKEKYKEGEVPRPPLWGGYIVKPHTIEFWQGQTDRIHDRIRFRRPKENEPDGLLTHQGEDGWIYERLYP